MSNPKDMKSIVQPGFTSTTKEEFEAKYETARNPDGFWDLWGWFDHPCAEWTDCTKVDERGRCYCPPGCSNWDKPCPRGFYHANPCGYCKIDAKFFCGEKDLYASKSPADFGVPMRQKGFYHPDDPGCREFIQHYAPPGSRRHLASFQRNYTPLVAGLLLASAGLVYAGYRRTKTS